MIGCLNLAIAVIVGAFGAHALKSSMTEEGIKIYQTGTLYHLVHGIGILLATYRTGKCATAAAWLFLVGCALFAGSLYLLAITQNRMLGMITPLGGVCFISGWISLSFSEVRHAPSN